jgi:16S rRNA (uracil1498-N3)-methyltransferase
MPISRLFTDTMLAPGKTVELAEDQTHYLRHVMRLKPDDRIILFDGKGGEYRARIVDMGRRHARCEPESFDPVDRELSCRIHIIQAANRSEKIETVLQKCTELGAASFQICASERAALRLDAGKRRARLGRWQRIIVEAAEQSGRTAMPEVQWLDDLASIRPIGAAYTLHPEGAMQWAEARDMLTAQHDVSFAVGPEGGWSVNDLARLAELGFQSLRFGPRILRTETAAPALTAALQALRG